MLYVFQSINESTEKIFTDGILTWAIGSAILILAGLLLLKLLKRLFGKLKTQRPSAALSLTFLYNVLRVLLLFLIVMGVIYKIRPLQSISVSLLASSGIAAVAIGIAAQDGCANIIGGLFISLVKPFEIGDRLKVLDINVEGVVENITARHTVIRTFQNNRVIVPNKIMNSAVLENYKFKESEVCNFLDLSVAYESDVEQAIAVVQSICQAHPSAVDKRSEADKAAGLPFVTVRVTDLADSGIALRALIWSNSADEGVAMLSDLRAQIKKAFDEAGIGIPYPTRQVYLKKGE